MTTVSGARTVPRRFGPRGLTWLVIRQHRTTGWIALGLLAVLIGLLVWLRMDMAHYGGRWTELRDTCVRSSCSLPHDEAYQQISDTYDRWHRDASLTHYIGLVVQYLPFAVAAFVAGPLVARELESGTFSMVWTQSVKPLRWFAAKLALSTVAVLAGVSLLSAVYTWAWSSEPANAPDADRWYAFFGALGPVPVAGALLGVALGALVGLLARRTVPAMTVALVAYGALRWALGQLRPHLMTPKTETYAKLPGFDWPEDGRGWSLTRGIITRTGERLSGAQCDLHFAACERQYPGHTWYIDYQPTSHHWPLAWAESGILVAVAVLAAVAAVRVLRRTQP